MLRVTIKIGKLWKMGWYYNTSRICSKNIKTWSLVKNDCGRRTESSQDKKEKEEIKKRYF